MEDQVKGLIQVCWPLPLLCRTLLKKPCCCVTERPLNVQDFELPAFNKTFLDNLEGLKNDVAEEEWKVSACGDIANS